MAEQEKLWEVQESEDATAVGGGEADMQRLVRGNQEYMNSQRMVPMPADEELESFMRNPKALRLIGMTRLRYGAGGPRRGHLQAELMRRSTAGLGHAGAARSQLRKRGRAFMMLCCRWIFCSPRSICLMYFS